MATREWFKQELTRLGFSFPEPMGNFVFATHPKIEAKKLFSALREEGIYVR
jgi:histidinol-phosphate aminotransferase